jgi:hemerythrin HHE cation binding domain-containing protein
MLYEYGRNVVVPALFALVVAAPALGAQDKHMRIPESLRLEHHEIHDALVRATKAADPVGAAARELARVLDPHFVREEQIALPPLGLLAPLARGESISDARTVLAMTDTLRAELPSMLEQHKAIRAATMRLREVAHAAGNAEVEELAHKLALHAQNEEEVTYPAAVLVGEIVRNRER